MRRAVNVERTENCGFRAGVGFVIVHRYRQHGQAEHVGQQNKFLAFVVSDMAAASNEVDRFGPFSFCQLHFAGEVVQMQNETVHDLFQTRVIGFRLAFQDCFSNGFVIQIAHNRLFGVVSQTKECDVVAQRFRQEFICL